MRKLTGFGRAAHECANLMSLANRFFYGQAADAARCADYQYVHRVSFFSGAALAAVT
jgi:hypothetical protein